MAQNAPAVFVSYSSEDSDFALRLSGDLKAAGASVWLDKFDIVPGQRWDRAVEDALTNCALMLVVLSPDSVGSNNVMDEVSHALDAQKTVIPVLYRECVIPFRLRRVQYVDFRGDYDRAVRLLKTLVIGAGVLLPERFRRGEALGLHPDERQADTKEFNAKPHVRRGDADLFEKSTNRSGSLVPLSCLAKPRNSGPNGLGRSRQRSSRQLANEPSRYPKLIFQF